ncbi:MAG: site-2 protease family protein [Ardenticatenales bacterium]|nr:site-2 protease family protein [Ardenticatenales bacterium]
MGEQWNWDALLRAEPPVSARTSLEGAVEAVMDVRLEDVIAQGELRARRWVGLLRLPAEEALPRLTPVFAQDGFTAVIQALEERGEIAILAVPGVIQPTASRLWLALLLFVLTILTTVLTGFLQSGSFIDGVMFSATLLSILLAHELGHFLASRRLGVAVSYPFFIPLPPGLSVLGTMGAVIQMKEPPPDRRALFTIGVAGPLAGLALAIPLTLLGLSLSVVEALPVGGGYVLEGNNLLYVAMKWVIFQQWLPSNGMDVMLHPIAFAGWAGMLVTALNLLPAGQLDGGHVIFALFGRRWAQYVTYGIIGLLTLLGFVWTGWWIWAVLISLLARRHAPILNDVTPLGSRQRVLALITLLLFALLFTPTPLVQIP